MAINEYETPEERRKRLAEEAANKGFLDYAGEYAGKRFDSAMNRVSEVGDMFTDPGAAMRKRFGIEEEQQQEAAKTTPVKQTIITDPDTGEQTMKVEGRVEDLSAANPNTPTVTAPAVPGVMPTAQTAPAAPAANPAATGAVAQTQDPAEIERRAAAMRAMATQGQAAAPAAPSPAVAPTPVAPTAMAQAAPAAPAAPIDPNAPVPNIGQPPTPGQGVQVAGATQMPPAAPAQNVAATSGASLAQQGQAAQAAQAAPVKSEGEKYAEQINAGGPGLYSLLSDGAGAPRMVKWAAVDKVKDSVDQERIRAKAEETANKITDPNEAIKVFNEFKRSKSEDGSYLRAYLLKRFGFDAAADDEMSKLGWGAKYEHTILDDGTEAMIKYSTKGEPLSGIDANSNKLTTKQLIAAGAMKGAQTALSVGYDRDGNVISHRALPNGRGFIWKNETTGETLKTAPEGYHQGKNQQEVMAIQAFKSSIANDEAANRRAKAKGEGEQFTAEQIQQRANTARAQIMGLSTTTYGAGREVEPAAAPGAAASGAAPTVASAFTDPSIKVISAKRTPDKQAALYQQSVDNGTPGRLPNGNPVAKPGTSAHEGANAIDVDSKSLTRAGRAELAQKGYFQPLPNDPNHWELLPGRTAPAIATQNVGAPDARGTKVAMAQQIANYEIAPSKDPVVMAEVRRIAPDYSEGKFKAANTVRNDYAKVSPSSAGGQLQAVNRAIPHLEQYRQAVAALNNGDMPKVNAILQLYDKNVGDDRVAAAKAIQGLVSTEVQKAVAGGLGGVEERKDLKDQMSTTMNEKQLNRVINEYQGLMAEQARGLKQNWTSHNLPAAEFDQKLVPAARDVINRPHGAEAAAPQSPADKARAEIARRKKQQGQP